MRHIVRAGAQVVSVARRASRLHEGMDYVELVVDDVKQVLLLPAEARDLAERLRGVADAIEEPQRKAAKDERQLELL